jgi:hypothetical protein
LFDFLEWFWVEVAVMPTAFIECNENITCYALIGIFQMLVGEGCEHLSELKKLALSCDASILQDFPVETGRIAKRLVKNCWTKHGLPYCMQKIKEENWVSSTTLSLGVDLRVSLSNYPFLTSPRLMKISEAVIAMRVLRLLVIACKWRFLCEGPPLLGQLGITPRRRLPRLMWPLLQRCECLRADLFLDGWYFV